MHGYNSPGLSVSLHRLLHLIYVYYYKVTHEHISTEQMLQMNIQPDANRSQTEKGKERYVRL